MVSGTLIGLLGAFRSPIRLVFCCSFKYDWAVLYGLRSVFSCVVGDGSVGDCRLSHVTSSAVGESGSGGRLLPIEWSTVRFWLFMDASCELFSGTFGVDFLLRDGVVTGDLWVDRGSSCKSCFSVVSVSKWSVSMSISGDDSCLVFFRNGDGPMEMPWLSIRRSMILSSLASI